MNDEYFRQALSKAYFLVARAEHCRRGLGRKLLARGFDEPVVTAVLDRLSREGLLDDGRYSRLWIDSRLRRKREGALRLEEGLVKRGIDRSLASEVVAEARAGDAYRDALAAACEELGRKHSGDRRALVYRLERRGFIRSEIRAFFEEFG